MGTEATISLVETTETLGENVKVDRDAGVIRGVKILGLISKNGREYLREAVGNAARLYEGKPCNINHPAKPKDSRVCEDRFAVYRNVQQRSDGCLYGDLHYLKSHSMAEKVCEDAERKLGAFGMSHVADGRVVSRGGKVFVEEIKSVTSVDLVADPATTRGLFEQMESKDMELQEELAAEKSKVVALTADVTSLNAKVNELQEQLDAKTKEVAEAARKDAVNKLFVEHKVDKAKVPAGLLSIIEAATLEQATEAVKGLAGQVGKPKSAPGERFTEATQNDQAKAATDGKTFAKAIRA